MVSKKTVMSLNEVKTDVIRRSILNLDYQANVSDSLELDKSDGSSPSSSIDVPEMPN